MNKFTHTRKLALTLLVLAFALFGCLGLVGCDDIWEPLPPEDSSSSVVDDHTEHEYVKTLVNTPNCSTAARYEFICECGEKLLDEFGEPVVERGEIDPSVHMREAYPCGIHCPVCSTILDHDAPGCGVEGHYNCDGFNHLQCTIPSNGFELTEINDGAAYRVEKFTAAGNSKVIIPAYVNDKPVVELADDLLNASAYEGDLKTWLESVEYVFVPDTVNYLGANFACNLTALETLRYPANVMLGGIAFINLPALTDVSNEGYDTLKLKLADFSYAPVEGGVEITGYTGIPYEVLEVPSEILGRKVVGIAANAFNAYNANNAVESLNAVKKLVLPEITYVGDYNFYGMDALEEVILPETVKSVGAQCFFECALLAKVYIPAEATVDMSRASFASCPSLAELTLPKDLRKSGELTANAFAGASENLVVTFAGPQTMWELNLRYAKANVENLTVVYNNGKETVKDGNGVEYLLNDDGESYTMVGFYDTVNANGAPVAGYIIAPEWNGKPITAIGDAVFNAKAYFNTAIGNWLASGMGALVFGTPGANDSKVEYFGNYNFVGMKAVNQWHLPLAIKNERLIGCFVDVVTANYLRIPKGVKVLEDCLSWYDAGYASGWFGNPAVWFVIPSTLERYEGECWYYNAAPGAFFTLVDMADAECRDWYKGVLNNSKITTATWAGAGKVVYGQFVDAQFVCGTGGIFPGTVGGITYDIVYSAGF